MASISSCLNQEMLCVVVVAAAAHLLNVTCSNANVFISFYLMLAMQCHN